MRMRTFYLATLLLLIITCQIALSEDSKTGAVPAGTGIGQVPQVNEVTRLGKTPLFTEYMPLDKGSVWTYEVNKNGETAEHSQKIISVSGGWSVFDNYFGKKDTALRIAPEGELLFTRNGVVSSFYTDDVIINLPEEPVVTPSGKFNEAMVLTIAQGDTFWFRDVYLKGIGLVFHEHKSPKGHTFYTLKKANVGGSEYPAK